MHKMVRNEIPFGRRALLGLLSIFVGLGFTLLLLEGVLRFLPVPNTGALAATDPVYRVNRFQPGSTIEWSTGWRFAARHTNHINNYGYAADVDFLARSEPALGIVGDSYVEALLVRNTEALQALLARAAGAGATVNGPVYGVGSSGAQLPTYLAYADFLRREFQAKAMAFVIIANDFDESACATANIRGDTWCFEMGTATSPGLVLKTQPPRSWLRRTLSRSALLRYLSFNVGVNPLVLFTPRAAAGEYVGNVPHTLTPERVATARAAVDAFFESLPAKSGLPPERITFLMDGIREDVYSGKDDGAGSFFDKLRRYFMAAATTRGYEVIDLQDAFSADYARFGQRFDYPTDNHWNALGHWVAADALATARGGRAALGGVLVPRPTP